MSQSTVHIQPERVQHLVLVRLLASKKPLTAAALEKSIVSELSPVLGSADAKKLFDTAVKELEQRNDVKQVAPPKGKQARPTLTDGGRQRALAALGLKAPPAKLDWSQAKRRLALHTLAPAQAASSKLNADAIATQILIAQHGLPASIKTLRQAIDRLAWRALELDTDAPFTTSAVQKHVLRAIVPADTRASGNAWRRMFAMKAARASGNSADALARALLASNALEAAEAPKIQSTPQPRERAPAVSNDNGPNRTKPLSLADFARSVANAAQSPQVRRFHGDRAFIGSVWDYMRASKLIGDMSLEEFKNHLVSAHRKQLLEIVRADLVGAMDPNEVRRSEARHDNATYHFVALNAGGMR